MPGDGGSSHHAWSHVLKAMHQHNLIDMAFEFIEYYWQGILFLVITFIMLLCLMICAFVENEKRHEANKAR